MAARPTTARDYAEIARTVAQRIIPEDDRVQRMRTVVDCLWEHLAGAGVSWVGFYLKQADSDTMVLGPRRDKPACSPIGLHGACGRSFLDDRPLVVRDVAELGPNYIACDPKDRSEAVIPIHQHGTTVGVLDLDSYEVGAFGEADVAGLRQVLQAAGLDD